MAERSGQSETRVAAQTASIQRIVSFAEGTDLLALATLANEETGETLPAFIFGYEGPAVGISRVFLFAQNAGFIGESISRIA